MSVQQKRFPLRAIPFFFMLLMIVLTIIFALVIKFQLDVHLRDRFDIATTDITQKVADRLLVYKIILKGGKGLFQITSTPTREDWKNYLNTIDTTKNYPGINALGYMPYITSVTKHAFITSVQNQGISNYTIYPSGNREIYTPILYVEPLAGNESILGFDMMSDPIRKVALDEARDTGTTAVTNKVILHSTTKQPAGEGFLLFVPVYKDNAVLQTVAQRRANIIGYTYGVFRTSTLFQGIFNNPNDPDIDYELYDTDKTINSDHLLYDVIPNRGDLPIIGFSITRKITVANHTWLFEFHTLPQFFLREKSRFIVLIFLVGGITVSILVGFLINFLMYGKERAEKIASTMTEKLRESEERYRTIFEKLQDVYYETDLKGMVTIISPSIEQYTGLKPEEILGKDATQFYKNPAQRDEMIKKMMKEGEVRDYEVELLGKEGKVIPVSVTSQILHNAVGLPRGVAGVLRDMTSRKLKEDTMLESIGDGVIATDEKGIIIFANNATEDLLKKAKSDLIGKALIDVLVMTDAKGKHVIDSERPIKEAIRSHRRQFVERNYERNDKTIFPSAITVTPIINDGVLLGTIQVFRDITEQKNLEKQKDDFLSITAHQLRTPLGIIRWSIESLLKKKPTQAQIMSSLSDIYASNLQLILLVNDLLDVSRIDQHRIQDNPEKTDVIKSIQNVIKGLDTIAKKRKISVKLLTEQKKMPVYIDPSRLSQVIQNILSNAIKYNKEKGTVTITIAKKESFVQIEVTDTGIGVPEKDQTHIFEKFSRGSNVKTTNVEGTGLGLFVVKSYVEQWGGKISLKSKVGKGTTVHLEIPIKTQKAKVKGKR